MFLLKTQQANCERSLSPWSCSPAGFVVQIAMGLSAFDRSPSPEAQSPPGGDSSILASADQLVRARWIQVATESMRPFEKSICLAEVGVPFLHSMPIARVIACDLVG